MKRVLVLSLFIAIIFLTTTVFGDELEYYENTDMGFAVYYPSTWMVLDEGDGQISFLSSEEVAYEDVPGGGVLVMSIPLSRFGTDDLVEAYEMATIGMMEQPGISLGDLEDTEIAGYPAVTQDATMTDEDIAFDLASLIAEDRLYVVFLAAHPIDHLNRYQPIFDEMLSTLDIFTPMVVEEEYYEEYEGYGEYGGDIYYVLTDGDAGLQETIDMAGPGDTIFIQEGTYTVENSLIIENKESLTISGEGEVWIISENPNADVIAVSNSTEIELSFLKARHEELDPDFECQGAVQGGGHARRPGERQWHCGPADVIRWLLFHGDDLYPFD